MPEFSIVVPAFNAEATIAEAVASALAQTNPDLEVIVVDDGSTDATVETAESISDPRVRVIQQSNKGPASARNNGLAAATGRFATLLDSDDLLLPRYLDECKRALARQQGAGFAYTDAYVFDDLTRKVRRRTAMARSAPPEPPPADPAEFLYELLKRNFVFISVTISTDVLTAVGGFDESRKSASTEDYELWLRIVLAGNGAAWVPSPQALYRKHAAQASRSLLTMSANLLMLYESLEPSEMPSDAHRELLLARRRSAARQTRLLAAFGWTVPQRLITRLKRAGVTEDWYEQAPPEVAATLAYVRTNPR
ncbi:MAG: glycosyltransferase family 2 protein [Solirubrobacteraceae bacterium]